MSKIIIISLIIVSVLILLNIIFTTKNIGNIDREKLSMYECGFVPFESTRKKYLIKYYIIGLIFLIFDLEAMLLYPTTKILEGTIGKTPYTVILFFIIILVLGLIYEIKSSIVGLQPVKPYKK